MLEAGSKGAVKVAGDSEGYPPLPVVLLKVSAIGLGGAGHWGKVSEYPLRTPLCVPQTALNINNINVHAAI